MAHSQRYTEVLNNALSLEDCWRKTCQGLQQRKLPRPIPHPHASSISFSPGHSLAFQNAICGSEQRQRQERQRQRRLLARLSGGAGRSSSPVLGLGAGVALPVSGGSGDVGVRSSHGLDGRQRAAGAAGGRSHDAHRSRPHVCSGGLASSSLGRGQVGDRWLELRLQEVVVVVVMTTTILVKFVGIFARVVL